MANLKIKLSSTMWNKYQNKKQQYNHLHLPDKLFQVLSFSFYTKWLVWFNLDLNIRNLDKISIFKSRLFSFICPVQTNIYNFFDPKGLTFLTRFSHLNKHRFWNNFQDCLNPTCSWSLKIEDTSHYLFHWNHFSHSYLWIV